MTENVWTIRTTLSWMSGRFKEMGSPTALLDAQLLLAHVLSFPKIRLYTDMDRPLSESERGVLRDLVKRRLLGEPVAYLLNQKTWHDLDLFVDKRVLIPRPETETLLDFVLGYAREASLAPRVIFDFCTGSGCLAIALAKKFPDAQVVGVDISAEALEVACINAKRNNVTNVRFVKGDVTLRDCYAALQNEFGNPDIIVSNPPYVSEQEWQQLDIEVRDFEPRVSLVAADNGLSVINSMMLHFTELEWLDSAKCLAIELAESHPQSFISETENQSYAFRSLFQELPKSGLFALRDFEERARFLCLIQPYESKSEEAELETVLENEPGIQI